MLEHGGRGVTLNDCQARAGGIIVVAARMHVTVEIEVLILKRVGQFVRQRHGLHVGRNPIGNEHRSALVVVKPRGLFGVESDQEPFQVEVPRHQAQRAHQGLLRVDFRRRHFFVQVLFQVLCDLRSVHDLLLQRSFDRQAGKLTHFAQDIVCLRKQRLEAGLLRGGFLRNGHRQEQQDKAECKQPCDEANAMPPYWFIHAGCSAHASKVRKMQTRGLRH